MSQLEWCNAPPVILIEILSRVTNTCDSISASLTCKHWQQYSKQSSIWRKSIFIFQNDKSIAINIAVARRYGAKMTDVTLILNQKNSLYRKAALDVLDHLIQSNLSRLTLVFAGENPLLYSGTEFVDRLSILFAGMRFKCLEHVDLSLAPIKITDSLISTFCAHKNYLTHINIQNMQMVVSVSKAAMKQLVIECAKLRELHCHFSSIDNQTLELIGENCPNFKRLGFLVRGNLDCEQTLDLYVTNSEAWMNFRRTLPTARVSLAMDYTVSKTVAFFLLQILMPIDEISIESYTYAPFVIEGVLRKYAHDLRKICVRAQAEEALDNVTLALVDCCPKLEELNIYAALQEETIEQIRFQKPQLYERSHLSVENELRNIELMERFLDEIHIMKNVSWPRH